MHTSSSNRVCSPLRSLIQGHSTGEAFIRMDSVSSAEVTVKATCGRQFSPRKKLQIVEVLQSSVEEVSMELTNGLGGQTLILSSAAPPVATEVTSHGVLAPWGQHQFNVTPAPTQLISTGA